MTLLVLLCHQLIRLLFYVHNRTFFNVNSLSEYVRLALHSIRFDLSVFCTLNLLFLAIVFFPISYRQYPQLRKFTFHLFLWINTIAFLFELADIGYFPYVRKRMTWDVFELIGRKSDFLNVIPSYFMRFWYLFFLVIIFLILFGLISKKLWNAAEENSPSKKIIPAFLRWLGVILFSIVAIRGGFQLKPILINNALLVASNEQAPLVYGSTFSILHSVEEEEVYAVHYFNPRLVDSVCKPIKDYSLGSRFRKKNVVVIILESFGKLYTGRGGRTSYTPFLDSLSNEGLYCSRAFANASTSAMGIPSVLAGIPAFYNEAFTTSPYGRNKIDALGNVLGTEGYSTSFFHGGTNGTMNFHVFAKNAGFNRYVGRNEYPDQKDYDGTWGIWDDRFLQFFANELNREKQPFLSAIFTLSSHEPFRVPKDHPSFLDTLQNIQKGIAYSDYALRLFFQKAKQMPWYQNTLFVLTADHAYMACHDPHGYYNQGMGMFSIPILYFDPEQPELKGTTSQVTQQIDILPSILDYLHYPNRFFAFGHSILSKEQTFMYNCLNNQQMFASQNQVVIANDTQIKKIFSIQEDSNLVHIQTTDTTNTSLYFKSFLQLLHSSLIQNTMSSSTYPKTEQE